MPNLESFYEKVPILAQNILLSIYGYLIQRERHGSDFDKISDFLNKSQFYSIQELQEYQKEHLLLLIKHAYENVPYYNEKFKASKLLPTDIKDICDLHKLPILTRSDIHNNFEKLIARNIDRKKMKMGHTSGTTGSPLEFLWDHNLIVMNNGVHWRQRNWAALNFGDKFAVLLGRVIVPIKQKRPPFWRYNYIHKQLWMSSFHLTKDNLKYYIDKLYAFKPVVLEGYPSTMYILAKYLDSQNIVFPLKSILTSAETLYPQQREIIEKVFSCKIFDYYGMAERVVFATECEKHEGHHLNMEFGITEILKKDGEAAEDGEIGRIVATCLHNYGMPLIRYRTGDVSAISRKKCSCGRELPLMNNVTTKAEDIVTTKDGRYISSSVLTHPFKPLQSIAESQIIQENIESLTIKIVKKPGYNDEDEKHLLTEFSRRLGSEMKFQIEYVDEIERTKAGKFRWVISKVPLKF